MEVQLKFMIQSVLLHPLHPAFIFFPLKTHTQKQNWAIPFSLFFQICSMLSELHVENSINSEVGISDILHMSFKLEANHCVLWESSEINYKINPYCHFFLFIQVKITGLCSITSV